MVDRPQEVPKGKVDGLNEALHKEGVDGAFKQGDSQIVAQAGGDQVVGNAAQGAMHLASLAENGQAFGGTALQQALKNMRDAGLIDEDVANLVTAAATNPEVLKRAQTSA